MNADDRILRNPRVALAPADEGYLAFNTENCELHRLNTAASVIVELSNGTLTATEVCRQVSPLLGNPESAQLLQWIRTAISEGLLKSISAAEPIPPAVAPEEFAAAAKELRSDGMVLGAFVCQHYATFLLPGDPAQWQMLGELAHIVGRRD